MPSGLPSHPRRQMIPNAGFAGMQFETSLPVNEETRCDCGGETILLVDDEPAVRNIVRIVLTRQGYKVLEATSGVEAVRLAEEHGQTIDLLVSDVIMPGMPGPEVARAVQQLIPSIRVIFMSGYIDDPNTRANLNENVNFVQKPFSSDELLQCVRGLLTK